MGNDDEGRQRSKQKRIGHEGEGMSFCMRVRA